MATVKDVMGKLADANLPHYVADTTLPNEKLDALRAIVAGKEYKDDRGLLSYFIKPAGRSLMPSLKATRAAAIMAKELLLAGNQPVFYCPLAEFLREVRLLDYSADMEPVSPVLSRIGKGYLVIADFDDTSSQPSSAVWHDGLAQLVSHRNRGGGLLLVVGSAYSVDSAGLPLSFTAEAKEFTVLSV